MAEGIHIIGLHPITAWDVKDQVTALHLPHTGPKAMIEDDQYLPARKRVALNYIRDHFGLIYQAENLGKTFMVRSNVPTMFVQLGQAKCKRLYDLYESFKSERWQGWRVFPYLPAVCRERRKALKEKLERITAAGGARYEITVDREDLGVKRVSEGGRWTKIDRERERETERERQRERDRER